MQKVGLVMSQLQPLMTFLLTVAHKLWFLEPSRIAQAATPSGHIRPGVWANDVHTFIWKTNFSCLTT